MTDLPVRGQLLALASEATCGQRNLAYGDPSVQLALAGQLKHLCHSFFHAGKDVRHIKAAEWEAIDMCLTKLSRIVMGPVITKDTYIDLAAYAAIAGECALKDQPDANE